MQYSKLTSLTKIGEIKLPEGYSGGSVKAEVHYSEGKHWLKFPYGCLSIDLTQALEYALEYAPQEGDNG